MKKRAFIDKISVPVTQQSHPHLYRRVAEFAQELGVAVPEMRVVIGQKAGRSLQGHSLAFRVGAVVLEDGSKTILIGNRFLRHFNKAADGTLSEGMAAVLAHEMAHIKHDMGPWSLLQWRGRMPVLGAAVGLAAMGMYHYYTSSVARQAELEADIRKAPHEPRGEVTAEMGTMHTVLVAAQYVVAGALGLAAGTWARKASSHFVEFRADRISAELLGDGKPLAQVLKGLRESPYRVAQANAFRKLVNEGMVSKEAYQEFIQKGRAQGKWTHPDVGERIRRLEAWTASENGLGR